MQKTDLAPGELPADFMPDRDTIQWVLNELGELLDTRAAERKKNKKRAFKADEMIAATGRYILGRYALLRRGISADLNSTS